MPTVLDQSLSLANALELAHGHFMAARFGEASSLFQAIIEKYPDCAPAHVNLAAIMLMQGRFETGWAEFEWRRHGQPGQLKPWDGRDLNGEKVLVRGEQGAGDNIQFLRYASAIGGRGGEAVVLTLPGMKRLFGNLAGVAAVLEPGDQASGLSYEVPAMSLPGIFGTTVDSVPADIPYLQAEPNLTAEWASRLSDGQGLKVGLCWQGNPEKPRDNLRSMPLAAFRPLMDTPGTLWVSLQVGAGTEQAMAIELPDTFSQLGPGFDAGGDKFIDSAAVIANLDLVITVDTSIAHLAGAMGRPVWVLLAFVADWRWMLEREDSPWYPTDRLFRQTAPGDWDDVIERVRAALDTFL